MSEFVEVHGDPSLATPEGQWRNMRAAAEVSGHQMDQILSGRTSLFLDFETPIDSHWAERLVVET